MVQGSRGFKGFLGLRGSGSVVQGLWFRVCGSWFRVHGLGFAVQGSGSGLPPPCICLCVCAHVHACVSVCLSVPFCLSPLRIRSTALHEGAVALHENGRSTR